MAMPDIPDFGVPSSVETEQPVVSSSPPSVLADVPEAAPPAADQPAPDTVSAPEPAEPAMQVADAAPPEATQDAAPVVPDVEQPSPEFPQVQEPVQEVVAEPPVEDLPDVLGAGGQAASQIQGGGAESGVVGRGGVPSPSSTTPMESIVPPAVAMPSGADIYYDSTKNVPSGPMASIGPRKADPVMEPASKFVVARKTGSEKSEDALVAAANRALKLGRYEAAAEMFDQLYEKNRRDPRVLMGRAVAYQNSGRPETALRSYEELLDVDKDNADALVNMLGLLRQQYPEVALRRLLNLFDKHPGHPGVAAQIGLTQADLGHYDDALRYLGVAASIEPQNAQHQFNMGVVADRMGRSADAVRFYEQALEIDSVYGGGRTVSRDQIYDRLSVLRRR
ncbi:MAG: tetratricopeptide repeat protein [Proteobacteria bacterium]|nr:tetratricopeptide repeat protein [Pseudomonadota bacterium]